MVMCESFVDGPTALSGVALRGGELDSFSYIHSRYMKWLGLVCTKGRRDIGQLRNSLYLLYLVDFLSGLGAIDGAKRSLISGLTQPQEP